MVSISKAMHTLLDLFRASVLDPVNICDKAKVLLSVYRQMSCLCTVNADEQICELKDLVIGSLDEALVYLINFAPKEKRQHIQDNLFVLFQNRAMLQMCENALSEVEDFPAYGELYRDILMKVYFDKKTRTEKEMLEILNMERSVYYDRKKEAVLAFGLALWGKVIPGIIK